MPALEPKPGVESATPETAEDAPRVGQAPVANAHAAGSQQRVTVWFDADCPLCVREIALMRQLDRRDNIEFVAVQGADACPLDREALLARMHARDEQGVLQSGAAAFAVMWRAIPILRPLGIAAQWPPFLAVLEMGYRGFLRVRPYLQRFVRRLGLE